MKNLIIAVFLFIYVYNNSYSQITLDSNSVSKALTESPAFTIYKDNYFITGTTLEHSPTKQNSDAKFQISFKYRIMDKPVVFNFYPYLTYTQKSFWSIYLKSSPFAESNYNPAIHFIKPIYKNNHLISSIGLSIEHESNGRDTITGSRSWNYVAAKYSQIFSKHLNASLKIWFPFCYKTDNNDLMKYIGYTEASINWRIVEKRLTADLITRKGSSSDWNGNLQLDIAYRPFKNQNEYLMLQWWNGYAENLIEYNQKQNMFRIGIVLKPSYFSFY